MNIDLITFSIFAFIWGAIWGSFLNVVVHRMPRGLSLVKPPSHCPQCNQNLRWFHNIPLFSWLVLRGSCGHCKGKIPARYFFVELLTASLALALFLRVSQDRWDLMEPLPVLLPFLAYFAFICAIVAIAVIDFELTLIPDAITIPATLIGILVAWAIPETGAYASLQPNITALDSIIGVIAGVGLLLIVFLGYRWVTGRIGLGGGDFTLLAMIGAFLGWQALPVVLFLASVQGLIFAISLALYERVSRTKASMLLRGVHREEFWENHPITGKEERDSSEKQDKSEQSPEQLEEEEGFGKLGIPFGPFLGLASLEYLFFSAWFLRLFLGEDWPI